PHPCFSCYSCFRRSCYSCFSCSSCYCSSVHPLLRPPWSLLGAAAEFAAAVAPTGSAKWLRTLNARRDAADRWRAFGESRTDDRSLCWFHAPSVGEGLQALPVVHRLQQRANPPRIAVTWFSPSAQAFGARFGADFADYLLFDTASAARLELDALRPSALIYSKLDVW